MKKECFKENFRIGAKVDLSIFIKKCLNGFTLIIIYCIDCRILITLGITCKRNYTYNKIILVIRYILI